MSEQEMFTKKEAADFLRCHPCTVQALVASGQLKAKRTSRDKNGLPSGPLKITRRALAEYVDSLPDA